MFAQTNETCGAIRTGRGDDVELLSAFATLLAPVAIIE